MLASTVLILFMAYFTAFMETLTIASVRKPRHTHPNHLLWLCCCADIISPALALSQFPYYTIRDRFYMYTVGSVCYGIYFIVSFPMFYRYYTGRLWDRLVLLLWMNTS